MLVNVVEKGGSVVGGYVTDVEAVQVVGGAGYATVIVVSTELGGDGAPYETGGKLDSGASGTGASGGGLE